MMTREKQYDVPTETAEYLIKRIAKMRRRIDYDVADRNTRCRIDELLCLVYRICAHGTEAPPPYPKGEATE